MATGTHNARLDHDRDSTQSSTYFSFSSEVNGSRETAELGHGAAGPTEVPDSESPVPNLQPPPIPSVPTEARTVGRLTRKDRKSPKDSPGHKWRHDEVHNIPHNNMFLVITGLIAMSFLAALDVAVVAIALPTIVDDIGGKTGYSWVGSAYLLTGVCVAPLNGKLSSIVGRKPILFGSIGLFLLGSALCGAAQSFIWLALCRGVQGMGAGGIMQMTTITVTDITSMQERPMYDALIESTWALASAIGPLIGGLLTQHLSWRWCFFINLPIGVVAVVLLGFCLNLNPVPKRSVEEVAASFDYLGLFLLVSGTALLLLGFQFAETAHRHWRAPKTIASLVISVLCIALGILNEIYTTQDPIIPPRIFRVPTTACILLGGFIHFLTFYSASYYIPLYFTILGSNPTIAGVKTLPLTFGCELMSVICGVFISKTLVYKPFFWIGFVALTLGYGLMIMVDEFTQVWKTEVFLLVIGIGVGCLFQPSLSGIQAAMSDEDNPAANATYNLMTTLGGAIGISIGNIIFTSQLNVRLPKISGADTVTDSGGLSYTEISKIQPESLRSQVIHGYTKSMTPLWILFCVLSFIGLVLMYWVRPYPLDRKSVRDPEDPKPKNAGAASPAEKEQVTTT